MDAQKRVTSYIGYGIVQPLKIHSNAKSDIRELKERDVNGIGKLLALLREIGADDALLDRLNIRDCTFEVGQSGRVNAKGFASQRPARDLWRLKAWDCEDELIPYRVIYAFHPASPHRKTPELEILAVVERSKYNYERDHPITKRVLRDYDWSR